MKLKIIIPISAILIIITALVIYLNVNKTNLDENVVFNKIELIEELATAKQLYREIIYSKKTSDFLWMPLSSKEFLISIDFSVTAGIDISKGYTVKTKGGKTVITLPKGELLSIDAVDSSIKEYFTKQRFSAIKKDDYVTIIQATKVEILESDNIEFLISECEDSAREALTTLLQIANIPVEIKFSDSVIKEKT